MRTDNLLHWIRHRLRWLLWFALALPLAQVAVQAHALSHLQKPAPATHAIHHGQGDAHPSSADACPLCPVVAAIGAGGAPSASPTLAAPSAAHAAPMPAHASQHAAAPLMLALPRGPPRFLA